MAGMRRVSVFYKKRRESRSDLTIVLSLYYIASRSLLRNMREAVKGTTLIVEFFQW